jgi:branched-chain amino acid transport system substrate-binding protein
MNSRRRRLAGAVGVLTSLVLVAAACGAGGRSDDDGDGGGGGGASDVGVTDDSIAIGGTFPLTGVAAPGYSEIPTGAKAYFDFVNAAGGVNGRTIDFTVKDDGYDPTKTSSLTNELVLKDQVFATVGSLGTPTHSAVVDFLNDEEVPDLFVSSGSLGWGDDPGSRPMTFGWQPDYEIEGKVIGQYVADNMPDAKVGLFLQDDDFGEDAEKGVRQFLDDQVVEVQRYTSGNTDVGPQIAALQAKKPDIVLAFTTPSYTALAQLTSLTLGFKPDWYVSNVGSDPALVGSLRSTGSCPRSTSPASMPPTTLGCSCGRRSGTRTAARASSPTTASTACPGPTRSCRRSRPPVRTSPARGSSTPWRRSAPRSRVPTSRRTATARTATSASPGWSWSSSRTARASR